MLKSLKFICQSIVLKNNLIHPGPKGSNPIVGTHKGLGRC